MKTLKAIHPGKILKEEFLIPFNLSEYRLAKDIDVAPIRINEIIKGKRAISANTALRLGKYFENSPKFWLNLQMHYDLQKENEKSQHDLETKITINITQRIALRR